MTLRLFTTGLVFILAACHSAETGDSGGPIAAAEPVTGGYAPAAADDLGVKDAEQLAIQKTYEAHPTRMLATVTSREMQVVAGLNYRFEIGFGGGDKDFKKKYEVVVYSPLDGAMEVTSIKEIPVE